MQRGESRGIMLPMAKKKTHKKQSFKYSQPVTNSGELEASTPILAGDVAARNTYAVVSTTYNDNPYLGQDLVRLGIIATALVVLEFGLWVLFTHSSVGPTIYNLYKIAS